MWKFFNKSGQEKILDSDYIGLREIAYVAIPRSDVTATTPTALVTLPQIESDGVTPVVVEVQDNNFNPASRTFVFLYEGATQLAIIFDNEFGVAHVRTVAARYRFIPPAGSHIYTIRYSVVSGTTNFNYDNVVGGAFARILSTVAPPFAAGSLLPVIYATSLPASPVDGQEAVLVDSLTAPTYQWRFRYNASSSFADKWEFIGGPSAYASVPTSQSLTSTSYTDLTTTGPTLIAPRAGVYLIEHGAMITNSAAGQESYMTIYLGTGSASDNERVNFTTSTAGKSASVSRAQLVALLAGANLSSKYRVGGGTGTFEFRWMKLTPIRVS